MRILYVATDQTVPGTLGGSVHVQSVAEGLAALGHDVQVLVQKGGDWPAGPAAPAGSVRWTAMSPPFGRAELRWTRAGAVTGIGLAMRADVVIERYYNFGGEGVLAARRLGVPAVLEVNAPIVDYPGSPKARLDRALLFEPMRRWRERMCRATDLFVTPQASILPESVPAARVLEVEWGADTARFHPGATGPLPFTRDPQRILCVFAGAFRAWHGVAHFAEALARLHAAGDTRFSAVFIGDGPERARVHAIAGAVPGVTFTGAIPHAQLPACLAAADIGVAPFDPPAHGPLALGFYWSPLKIFEYMAAGLPVVAPGLPRLRALVEHDHEGVLYDPAAPAGIDAALVSLASASRRQAMGRAARDRAVRDYGWDAHCRALDARLRALRRTA
jgi:glycosyltransferase involved in cell wall biosynthesis